MQQPLGVLVVYCAEDAASRFALCSVCRLSSGRGFALRGSLGVSGGAVGSLLSSGWKKHFVGTGHGGGAAELLGRADGALDLRVRGRGVVR